MGLIRRRKGEPEPEPPLRRDVVRYALKLGMTWYEGDPDRATFLQDRDAYYLALEQCTPEEAQFVEDALKRHGYPP